MSTRGHHGLLMGAGGGGPITVIPDAKLILPFDGTDGSTTITDLVGTHSWGTSGAAQIDTAQSKWGGASCYFDGASSRVSAASHADFGLASSDEFTAGCWLMLTSLADNTSYRTIFNMNASGALSFQMVNGKLTIGRSGITILLQAPSAISDAIFVWVSACRKAGVLGLHAGGIACGAVANTTAFVQGAAQWGGEATYGNWLKGWIDDGVWVKGRSLYTPGTNYSPPDAPLSLS